MVEQAKAMLAFAEESIGPIDRARHVNSISFLNDTIKSESVFVRL